ncbi:Integrase [Marinobacter sp. ELB17]|nr:Integrase [Marinobacter sp. ELB17]
MGKHYHYLSTTNRVTLMFLKRQGLSLRAIASELNRSPSTLSRGLQRRTIEGQPYDAKAAGLAARSARLHCRHLRKLVEGTDLHEVVVDMLRNKWSPQQISGTLKAMFPHHREF